MNDISDFYRPFKEETFDDESCFLCGQPCELKTAEHIFPKWLQHEYDLWGKNLTISNDTNIPYRYLTVPCCSKCNNEDLSLVEVKFRKLLKNSFQNLDFEDELVVFQWAAKILYATRYKELSLVFDRKNPDLGKILSPFELEGYSSLHLFLQSVRVPTKFEAPKPWSLFIFQCQDEEFYYQNEIDSLCFTMKFGKVAFSIVFEENNLIEGYMHGFKKIGDYALSFPQYIEANAFIFYSAKLKNNVPKYVSVYSKKTNELNVITMGGLRSKDWNDQEFASVFDQMLLSCGINIGESVLQEDGNIRSFLVDENGEHITKKLFEK